MAETFLSPVIEKLFDLIVEEAKSLKGVQRDVQSLKKELEIIEPFLRDAETKSYRGELNEASKIWLKQLREEAERIEDVVDKYISHVEKHRRRRGFVGALHKACCSIKALSSHYDIASEITDIEESLRKIKDNGVNFGLRSFERGGSSGSAATTVDPRIGSLFIDDDELVGIDSTSKELERSLVEGPLTRTVISLVGEGGIGKTTLAKKVYKDLVEKGHFDCHVWITVSQSCNLEMILKIMKNEICPTTQHPGGEIVRIEALMELLRSSLTTKRYMIVFDDVWQTDFWGIVKHALPDNERGSRIILTTRNASIVESFKETSCDVVKELKTWSQEQAWELFCRIAFRNYEIKGCCPLNLEQMSRQLLSKCQGLPLAIAVVAGLLSKREKSQVEWQKVLDNFSYEFEENTSHLSILKVLLLSYHDLPYQLKLCFLYFGVFPEDYPIYDYALYSLWIAEGFIKSRRDNISLEEIAEEYLNELINRNLVSYEVEFGSDKQCRVHDLFHDLILKIFDDNSFCHIFRENTLRRRSRRLSNYGNTENALEASRDSNIRSIFNFNNLEPLTDSILVVLFKNCQLLRVLNLREALLDNLPTEVGSLFHLRYLDLSNTKVKILPKSIGNLRNLQTLNVNYTPIQELPIEIRKLTNLRHLYALCNFDELNSFFSFGVNIQDGIGRLEELQTLICVAAHPSGVGIVKELQKLRKLKCLNISKVTTEMMSALGNSIDKMDNLNELIMSGINANEVLDLDFNFSSPSLLLLYLGLNCRLRKMPRWILKLQKLQGMNLSFSRLIDEPLKYLKGLPNLAYLCLQEAYDGEELHFEEGSFQKLKELRITKSEELKVLKIDRGALPLLEKLCFGPSPLMKEMPSDIQHLQYLKSLCIFDMPTEFVMSLQPNGGNEHWKIQHIPSVTFWYYTGSGIIYDCYKIGSSELLQQQSNIDQH